MNPQNQESEKENLRSFKYSTQVPFAEFDDGDDVPTSLLIFTSKKVYDHGIERTLMEGQLKRMVENFNKGVLGRRVPVNYDHPASRMADSIAAGWVAQLNEGRCPEGEYAVYADISWNKSGRQRVLDREYLYTSIGLYFNYVDYMDGKTEHGPVLYELSLTNRPANLNIGAIKEFSVFAEQVKPQGEEMNDQEKAEFTQLKKTVESLSTENETMKEALKKEKSEFETQKADLEKRELEFAKKERSMELDSLVKEGRIIPAQKEKAMAMSKDAYTGFKTAIETMGDKAAYNSAPTSSIKNPAATDGMKNIPASEELHEKAMKFATEHKVDLGAAYTSVLSSDKALNERYEAELGQG